MHAFDLPWTVKAVILQSSNEVNASTIWSSTLVPSDYQYNRRYFKKDTLNV